MSTTAFDTLSASRRLREAGMDERTAEAVVALVQQTAQRPDISALATKDDVRDMVTRADLREMATKADISEMATKADLRDMATKADLREMASKADVSEMASKSDLRDMATKAELLVTKLELKSEIASLEARLSEKLRLQGWALLGGVAVLMTISTALIKLVPGA